MLILSTAVIEQARGFFEDCGASGCEGTALIAGRAGEPASRLVIPDQQANPVPYASVTVTAAGELTIAAALEPDEQYLARIHSHPGLAFHSQTDDENPILTHEGAVSIVVPFFGLGLRHGLDACAAFELRSGRWLELKAGPERDRVVRSA